MGLIQYIKETQAELKHVNWPSRDQVVFYTVMVIVISVGIALFLGFFDYIFSLGIQKILLR